MKNMVYFNISSIFLILATSIAIPIMLSRYILTVYRKKYPETKLPFEEKELNSATKFSIIFLLIVVILFTIFNLSLKISDFRFILFVAPTILVILLIYKLLFPNDNIIDVCFRIQKWIIKILKWFKK